MKNLGSQFDVAGKPEGLQISPAGCSYTQEHMSLKDKYTLNGRSTYSFIVTDALLAFFSLLCTVNKILYNQIEGRVQIHKGDSIYLQLIISCLKLFEHKGKYFLQWWKKY